MRIVLDASVAVSSVIPEEPQHIESRARVARVLHGQDRAVVPSFFYTEVLASCRRRGFERRGHRLLQDLELVLDFRSLTIRRARTAAVFAAATGLRAGDALYGSLALELEIPVVTYDNELLHQGICKARRP